MKNLLLNEKYEKNRSLFHKADGIKIHIGKKKLIDLSLNSGVLFFGHQRKLYNKIFKKFIKNKLSLSSHPNIYAQKLASKVKLFFPYFEKIVFCNSGTESVIRALRIVKSLSKKKIIISVSGSWHGTFDQTLFNSDKNLSPIPLSSGIDEYFKKQIKFIPYNDISKSKKILDKNKNKINSIIIEPVMGSLPEEENKKYLKFLEKYCKKNNIFLIFDEIITGFRTKDGSIQNKYLIRPDITLIGKILGGGLPIGALGLSKNILKKYNKLKKPVVFGGTFSANPFSCYSGYLTLTEIKKQKKSINKIINLSKIFQTKINNYIKTNNIDAKVYRFESILRVVFTKEKVKNRPQRDFLEKKNIKNLNNFKKFLNLQNIYYPPNGIIFISTLFKIKDLNFVIQKICIGLKKYFKNT